MEKSKEKYITMRDRQVFLSPNYWNGISQTHPLSIKHHGINPVVYLNLFDNGRMAAIYYKKMWDKAAKHIGHRLYNDRKYHQETKIKMRAREREAFQLIKNLKRIDLGKLTFENLLTWADKIFNAWLRYDMINVPPWFWGGDSFRSLVAKSINIPEDEFNVLTTPSKKTWASQMELDLLKYTSLIKKRKFDLEKAAGIMASKYAHLPFNYDGLEYWDENYFIKKLQGLVKKHSKSEENKLREMVDQEKSLARNKKKIIAKYHLNQKQKKLIEQINELAIWTDERKALHYKLHYYYAQILLEIGRRYDVPYKNLKFLMIEELDKVAKNIQEKQKLPGKKIIELAKLCGQIEKHYGFPCDIEWAMEKNNLYITQSRPITTL